MIDYFDDINEIEKEVFITRFNKHVREDDHENRLLVCHENLQGAHYYFGNLNLRGVENLVLPHHAVEHEPGKDPDRSVKTGGKFFNQVIKDYINNYIPNNRFVDCYTKAKSQNNRFFSKDNLILGADFLFTTNKKDVADLNNGFSDNYPKSSIFIGNGFHRMIAYGLFLKEYGFRPIQVHYVHLI